MKRIVITPTFRPHFPFNREFLQSYEQKVEDAGAVAVHFIVSRQELADMEGILREFPALDVHAHAFEDLLQRSGHGVEALDLLREIGKFAFQSLKKLYALKELEYDQALVLDSESLVLKDVRLGEVFDEYFADPYVFYSDLSHRGDSWFGSLSDTVTKNAARLLRAPYPGMYLLEYYGWFYEKPLVREMLAALSEDLLSATRRLGKEKHLFECVLYYSFLYANRERYPYRFVSINELLREYLGQAGYDEYIANFTGSWEPYGIFEYVSKEVSERNLAGLLRLFQDHRLRFYRSELVNRNERAQDALIAQSPITFLVSSENYRRIRERVAVCISGLPRNYRQNLAFVRSFLAESGADVFFHFWESPDQDFIVRSLEPKAHQFEPNELKPAFLPAQRAERFTPPQRDFNSVSMFYGIWKANELKRAYEQKHGFRYDVVVRLRLDFFSTATLNDLLQWLRDRQRAWENTLFVPDMAHSVGINDQIALGRSEVMDAYASAYGELPAFAAEDYFNPEYILLRHVLKSGLRIETFPFEYVLLRDDEVDTFDLEEHVRRTRGTWWSSQLPRISPDALTDYFRAKADSTFWVAELGVETPKVFRLAAPGKGYLRLKPGSRELSLAADPAQASLFFVIVAGDEDRTAVNLRCRDLSLGDGGGSAGRAGWNLHPDERGAIRPGGAADPYSAFFIARQGEGFSFEWQAGFWAAPDDRQAESRPSGGRRRRDHTQAPAARRLFLAPGPAGLVLKPMEEGVASFAVEYVQDRAAEASDMGIRSQLTTHPANASDPFVVRLLWRSYVAARVLQQHGVSDLTNLTVKFIRRKTYQAAGGQGENERAGLVNRTIRFLSNRM